MIVGVPIPLSTVTPPHCFPSPVRFYLIFCIHQRVGSSVCSTGANASWVAGVGAGGAAAEISGLEHKGDKWYEHYHAVRRVRESEVGMPILLFCLFGVTFYRSV